MVRGMASETGIIDLGGYADAWQGVTITVRAHRSFASTQRIAAASSRMEASQEGRKQRAGLTPDPLGRAAAVVDEYVIEWDLVGIDGEPLPASGAGVRSENADADLIDCAVDAIETYYEDRAPKLRPRD